ncbi:MAG: hypothetical protein LYZ66_02730 [Nitrososphaerales archaeon]|nr:hypothetical protein [Nitrososphaerales archaeon]
MNSEGQTAGVFLGSASMGPGQNATINVPLLNLPGGYDSYAAQVFATTASGIVLSDTATSAPFVSPFLIYLSASGYCSVIPGGSVPCWGGDAYVFNCVSEAASPQGCTHQVTSTLAPYPSYVINIRYPFANQTGPSWANCLWTVQGIEQGYAACVTINSTSFAVGIQAPPHL